MTSLVEARATLEEAKVSYDVAPEVYERYSQSESYLFPHPAGQHSHGDKPCLKN
jgi:hypothetical protein